MAKIVVGMFDKLQDAHDAVEDLVRNGFKRDQISLVAGDKEGKLKDYAADKGGKDISQGAAGGAGIGAVIGGLGGLLVGLGLLTIPGVGPVLAAGPLVSALAGAGIGAATGGLVGALVDAGIPDERAKMYDEGVRRGATLVTVNSEDHMADQAADILNRHNPMDVDRRVQEWQAGTTSQPEMRTVRKERDIPETRRSDAGETFEVTEEELRVGKRQVDKGGVRVHTYMSEKPVEENVNLRDEHVEVTRRPVDRPASEADLNAFQEGSFEVHETDEEVVVDKQARVVEEVEIHKDVEERQETVHDTLRRTEVDIEETGGRGMRQTADFDEYDTVYREHFNSNFGNTSYTYNQYRPYYQYGSELANHERYRNRRWEEVEKDARRDWERSHPSNPWEEVKAAVRQGWETVRGRR